MKDTVDKINPGDIAPDFTLPDAGGQDVRLSQLRSQSVVLYFYSKNNTGGCTSEALEFRDSYGEFAALNAVIVGISRDSVSSHEKFIAKHQLPFLLLSDAESEVSNLYGVMKLKNMYGKKVMGVERSTFLINPDGKITHVFRKVKVAGHAQACLAALKENMS